MLGFKELVESREGKKTGSCCYAKGRFRPLRPCVAAAAVVNDESRVGSVVCGEQDGPKAFQNP